MNLVFDPFLYFCNQNVSAFGWKDIEILLSTYFSINSLGIKN